MYQYSHVLVLTYGVGLFLYPGYYVIISVPCCALSPGAGLSEIRHRASHSQFLDAPPTLFVVLSKQGVRILQPRLYGPDDFRKAGGTWRGLVRLM